MSFLTRLSNIFTKEVDAYAFEKTGLTKIYVPSYDIYAHYYSDTEEFIPYKSDKPFDENNKDYTNVRKIKISTSFLSYLCDWYHIREENKKWCDQNKSYFDEITK